MKINHRSHHSDQGVETIALSRSLGMFTITMIGVGGMIGAGIFVLTGMAAGLAGPALVLAFLLNGIVTFFTAMAYAELGSAFPEAGGGYLWVKEGLGGAQGFLAGWMSWFAHVVAGSVYALGFGRFAAELWVLSGLSVFNLSVDQMTLGFMTLIIVLFTLINYLGASETGTIGNIVTMTKIFILALFILFGILVMGQDSSWQYHFTDNFLPNGFSGVLMAMGLTFIAFEGYEIIAQSGEEVKDPRRNIPRAIFLSIGIAVTLYILISIVAIGASTPPPGMEVYTYLGEKEEVAIVEVAKQIFPLGIGGIVLLFSGVVSTISALNATTYSSSRVSFAMGRNHNLPPLLARIHPKRHTPYFAVIFSGGLMALFAWTLPLESVAAAADIMFLLLFLQVNLSVMTLRHKMPALDRGFTVPWFPVIPIIGLVAQGILAIILFEVSPVAWFTAIIWIVIGLLAYYTYFARLEAVEKPKEILLEEVLVSREYSVLIPVATQEQARILGHIGSILAEANQGEVLALHVIKVPTQITLSEGRAVLKEARPYLDTVIQQAKMREVPVHTVIRLGRDVAVAVRKTADENASDIVVLGWPGYTNSSGRLFGSVIDPIVNDPPVDIAVVRYRKHRPIRSILVPVAGGPNSRKATRLAVTMAAAGELGPAKVTLLHILPMGVRNGARVRAEQVFQECLDGVEYDLIEKRIVEGTDVVQTILGIAQGDEDAPEYDLVILGATQEPFLKSLFMGTIPARIASRANVTVIMVKRRSSPFNSFLRQTVVPPVNLET